MTKGHRGQPCRSVRTGTAEQHLAAAPLFPCRVDPLGAHTAGRWQSEEAGDPACVRQKLEELRQTPNVQILQTSLGAFLPALIKHIPVCVLKILQVSYLNCIFRCCC